MKLYQTACVGCGRALWFEFPSRRSKRCSACGGDRRLQEEVDQAEADNRRLDRFAKRNVYGTGKPKKSPSLEE